MSRDRLEELEANFRRKKHHGTQLFWVKYNPEAKFKFDLIDAREDVEWMVAEIKRLREENAMLREMVESLKSQITDEIEDQSSPKT